MVGSSGGGAVGCCDDCSTERGTGRGTGCEGAGTRPRFSVAHMEARGSITGSGLRQMRAILAWRMTQSRTGYETTAVRAGCGRLCHNRGRPDRGYDVRIWTPNAGEVPFAGHPSLGAAHVIRQVLEGGRGDHVNLDLKVG